MTGDPRQAVRRKIARATWGAVAGTLILGGIGALLYQLVPSLRPFVGCAAIPTLAVVFLALETLLLSRSLRQADGGH